MLLHRRDGHFSGWPFNFVISGGLLKNKRIIFRRLSKIVEPDCEIAGVGSHFQSALLSRLTKREIMHRSGLRQNIF